MAVDNVNQGNYAVPMAVAGATTGALAGVGYGYLSKPWMNGEQLSDTFVKAANSNMMEQQAKNYETYYRDLQKLAETGDEKAISKRTLQKILWDTELLEGERFGTGLIEENKSYAKKLLEKELLENECESVDDLIKSTNDYYKKFANLAKMDISKDMSEEALVKVLKKNAEFFEIVPKAGQTLDDAVKVAIEEAGGSKKLIEHLAELPEVARKAINSSFDLKKGLLKEIPERCTDASHDTFNVLKKTMSDMQLKAAGKWAAIGAGALGVIGLGIGAMKKKPVPQEKPLELNA